MTDIERQTQERELSRYWDELLTPGAEPDAWGVDDSAVETLRQLTPMTRAPLPYVAVLRVEQGMQPYLDSALEAIPGEVSNGFGTELRGANPWSTFAPPARRVHDASASNPAKNTVVGNGPFTRLAQLAATLLLLVALGGLFLWLAPLGERARPGVMLPAIPGVTEGDTLLTLTLPAEAIPHGEQISVMLEDYSLGVEAESRWTPDERCCPGTWLLIMIDGALEIRSSGPANVLRPQSSLTPTTLSDGTAVVVGPGDTVLARFDRPFTARSVGTVDARFLAVSIIDGYVPLVDAPPEWTWHPDGAWAYSLDIPNGPAQLTLRKVVLDAGAALPPPPDAYAELGLTIADNEPLSNDDPGEILNIGNKPVTVHVLTLGPVG